MKRVWGPGLLVTAAFVGPGTVTTASATGAGFGYALLWALLFSVLATIVLQEMSARLGLVTRAGLGEALRTTFRHPASRHLVASLVVLAITFGNSAFETGNITGAAIALEAVTPLAKNIWAAAVGSAALLLLALGGYRHIEKWLMMLVALMSITFIGTACAVRPDLSQILRGALIPGLPPTAGLTVVALIGTTVVPYNLFLHASVVRQKWSAQTPLKVALRESRLDTISAILLGGLITLAITVTAAASFPLGTKITSAASMAQQLQPLLGPAARWFFAVGLFSAGLSSAITAPLAAAYATAGVLGWKQDLESWKFRAVWLLVIAVGTILAVVGKRPVEAIVFAQAANGVLLPLIAVFLLAVMNRRGLLGAYTNRPAANIAGGVVILIAAGLGLFQLAKALGAIPV